MASATASAVASDRVQRVLRREVDVGASGHTESIDWASAPGASDVEVLSAQATIGSAQVTAVQELPVSVAADGQSRDVVVPSGARVMALGLANLKWVHTVQPEGEAPKEVKDHLDSEGALSGANVRLVVSTPDARGEMAPTFAVPPVGRQGALPPQFAGASYVNSALDVHGLAGPKLRVMLTEDLGKPPQEWGAAPVECGSLAATLGWYPTALELKGGDDATLWAFPNEMTDNVADADVDLAAPVRGALVTALKAKRPLQYALTLRASGSARAHFDLRIDGAVVRSYANDVGASLAGEDRPLALDGDALGGETPSSVTADIAILYAGTRLLDEVNDPMPTAGGASGVVLTDQAVCQALPRPALARFPVVRVGIVGRAPEPCELSLQLVELRGGAAGAAYGNPGTLKVEPSAALAIHWIDLPEHQPLGATVALALRATSGRFFWVGKDRGLARVAVRDPDPGGRAVTIAGKPFALARRDATAAASTAQSDADRYEWKGVSLPVATFVGEPPTMSSLLFVTVNVRDLTLRYARQVRT